MKPHWQTKHDWWVEDFRYLKNLKAWFVAKVRKYPDCEIGDNFRGAIKTIDSVIKRKKKEYKKTYGVNFNMRMFN